MEGKKKEVKGHKRARKNIRYKKRKGWVFFVYGTGWRMDLTDYLTTT